MSVTYIAYICYPHQYSDEYEDDDEDQEPVIKFDKPEEWKYKKVLPIQFSILHYWTDKDKELYK